MDHLSKQLIPFTLQTPNKRTNVPNLTLLHQIYHIIHIHITMSDTMNNLDRNDIR